MPPFRLRVAFAASLLLFGLGRRPAAPARAGGGAARDRRPRYQLREIRPAQRAGGDPLRRPSAAACRGERLVPRGTGERRARPHRLRAPVRTHDVPGHRSTCRATALQVRRGRRRQRHQRHHGLRSDQLLRDAPGEPAGTWPVARVRSHGYLLDRSTRRSSRTSRTSFATSAGRAPRTGRTASSTRWCSTSCFRRAIRITATSSDRMPTSRRRSWTTCRASSRSTTRRTMRASRSWATSTRRQPGSWSRSTSAR